MTLHNRALKGDVELPPEDIRSLGPGNDLWPNKEVHRPVHEAPYAKGKTRRAALADHQPRKVPVAKRSSAGPGGIGPTHANTASGFRNRHGAHLGKKYGAGFPGAEDSPGALDEGDPNWGAEGEAQAREAARLIRSVNMGDVQGVAVEVRTVPCPCPLAPCVCTGDCHRDMPPGLGRPIGSSLTRCLLATSRGTESTSST